MKHAICSDTFPGWELDKIFRFAAELGYHGVELAPYSFCNDVTEVDDRHRRDMRRWAEAAGIEIAGLHALFNPIPGLRPVFSCPPDLQLNSADEGQRLRTKRYLLELMKLCGQVGGRTVVLGSAGSRNVTPPVTQEEAWRWSRDAFRECAEQGEHDGVILCIEPIFAPLTNFINTPEEADRMVQDVGHPNFKWILDVWAMHKQGVDPVESIERFGQTMAHVHVADDNKSWPGSGSLDFEAVAKALKSVNYDGYVSVEVMDLSPDPETIAREGIKYLQQVFV